jgi:hypothetical protein
LKKFPTNPRSGHSPDTVTEAMNKACAEIGDEEDRFIPSAARRILERSEW